MNPPIHEPLGRCVYQKKYSQSEYRKVVVYSKVTPNLRIVRCDLISAEILFNSLRIQPFLIAPAPL